MTRRRAADLRLTPLKALGLLSDVERAIGGEDVTERGAVLREVAERLRAHVQHGLSRRKRRRR